jgi:HAD superfamily hydrolase (TIGR01509 family)
MPTPAILFDLDGTLVDNVYEHVLAWREAFDDERIDVRAWRLHRSVGLSGDLLTRAIARELNLELDDDAHDRLATAHARAYRRLATRVRPLRGTRELLGRLTELDVAWAIGTNSKKEDAGPELEMVGAPERRVVTRERVENAKPHPDLFLEAARRLHVDVRDAIVVGDSVWDLLAARRARALGVGLLSGGNGKDELERAGAYRVYEDPHDLLAHLDEVGVVTD